MRLLTILFSLAYLVPSLGAEKNAEAYLKEGQEWAKKQLELLHNAQDGKFSSVADVLPLEDLGKKIDVDRLIKDQEKGKKPKKAKKLEEFLQSAKKKEVFEGNEPIFQLGHLTVEHPEKEIEITSIQRQFIEEETQLEKCQEVGNYQISFTQKRTVEVIPEIKQRIKKCLGHQVFEKFFWKSDAEKHVKNLKKEMSKDTSLSSYSAGLAGQDNGPLKSYFVLKKWQHKDNVGECTFPYKDLLIQPYSENDVWHTDFAEGLATIEANPNCRLLYAQVLEGPETRTFKGQAVFRDIWGRNLLFSCEEDAQSPCIRLRKLGGVLVKKKCLKENDFEECDLWEKTYDLGKKAAYQKSSYSFKDKEIIGLNGAFDSSYEKNKGFSVVSTILSVFSDIKKELETAGELNQENIEIFRGDSLRCTCSFLSGELYDCCKKMQGLAVSAHLAKCNEEEVALAEKRHSGKCHYIGSHKENLKTQTSKVFCCFPTKLARVVQEQGRKFLGLKWGTVEHPKCHGLSMENISKIDFSKIDLSEVVEDLAIDKEDLLKSVESTINRLQSQPGTTLLKTEEIVQKQKETLRHEP